MLKVMLLSMTENPISTIYAAFRQCYKAGFVGDLWEGFVNGDKDIQIDFIQNIMGNGHESPIEHVSFTFAIEGVSRALTHQLVRTRLASYSHQSQRYVNASGFDYIMPPSIACNQEARDRFIELMDEINQAYNDIISYIGEDKKEDARFVLPNATETKIVVTMNCRSLIHFFGLRCCFRSQWEIRAMANGMLMICKDKLPVIFQNVGANCDILGYCPELSKMSCGRKRTKAEMLSIVEQYKEQK